MLDKNKIEFFLWKFFTKIVHIIGFNRIHKFARLFSFVFFYLIPIRKDVVISNLKKAFPEKSEQEIKKIAFENYVSIGITFMEIMAFRKMSAKEITELVDVNNLELALEKVNAGNGTILLTAHFGNWELGALFMGLALNKQIDVLVKPQRNKLVAKWMSEVREKFGNKEVPLGISIRALYKTLINGGVIGIVGDQRGKKEDGVIVNFFNQPTTTFKGFAALGIKNKVPTVLVFSLRLPNGKFRIDIDEINYDNLTGTLEEQIKELNQRYISKLEAVIREHPEQWLWMHNIWKY
jgi:KDO2-lipid IV(A) lauroyltransferase